MGFFIVLIEFFSYFGVHIIITKKEFGLGVDCRVAVRGVEKEGGGGAVREIFWFDVSNFKAGKQCIVVRYHWLNDVYFSSYSFYNSILEWYSQIIIHFADSLACLSIF